MLAVYVSQRQDDWAKYLSLAEFSYNNAVLSTTKQLPFYLWYGEHPAYNAEEPREEKAPSTEELTKKIKELSKETKALIQIAQEKYKEQADKNRTEEPEFMEGEKVWLDRTNITTDRPARKLDWRSLGPFKITQKIGQRAYKLELPSA